MLKLSKALVLDKEALQSPNLADRFDHDDLATLGLWVHRGYEQDKHSRHKWERRTSAAMDLAMQVTKEKSFPWPNCANIAFPLVTIAALQFHARAYPTVVSGTDVVRCRVIGEDPKGLKFERAKRISCHMSYQVLEQDRAWEEQHDRLLIVLPIVGCAFKKSYFSGRDGHNRSELVMANDLVMDYYAKSTESCERKTHILQLTRNELYERVMRKMFCDVREESWFTSLPQIKSNVQQANKDRRIGQTPPAQADETTPFRCLEQHVNIDLDQDGYAEPYIVTIEEDSKCVLRLVTRFEREADVERDANGDVVAVVGLEYFTKYSFIPSPDGGIYDVGFGMFLGPLNESVNSIVNQLVDAGTMSSAAGGFLGRGAKIRGGVYTFSPFGWNRVDSTGDDLKKSIFPLPVREPSTVLFQLLSLLINYVNRVSGSTDLMVGENVGQNTPAQTADTMLEQGQKIYNSIFKRVWRGMKEEFKKLYILNGIFLDEKVRYGGGGQEIKKEDYLGNPNEVCPAADPNVTSDAQNIKLALTVKQAAMATPGYDRDAVEMRFLKALKVDAPEQIFPGTKGKPPPEDPKITLEKIKQAGKAQLVDKQAQQEQMQFVATLLEERRVNDAQIMKLEADAIKAVADIKGDKENRQIELINAQLGAAKLHNEVLTRHIDLAIKRMEYEQARIEALANGGGVAGVESPPGNGGGNGMAAAGAGGAQGGMGLGGLHSPTQG